jgi:hypothetical protein
MKLGFVGAVAGLALVGVACGGVEGDEELGELAQAHKNQCEEEDRKECVRIRDNQNITHVFLDFKCDAGDFEVTLETDQFGKVEPMLHENGGPCGEIKRDFWFPVPGPDKEAKVCVEFKGDKKAEVEVSYKAGGMCVEDEKDLFDGKRCEKCEDKKDDGKDDGRKDPPGPTPQRSIPGGDAYKQPGGIDTGFQFQFPQGPQ